MSPQASVGTGIGADLHRYLQESRERVLSSTAQHAGHADILRETVDGRAGRDHDEVGDTAWWARHVERVREAAEHHRRRGPDSTTVRQ
jgi:hypothetical protein